MGKKVWWRLLQGEVVDTTVLKREEESHFTIPREVAGPRN